MKSILLSVRPEWVAKILNGYKTAEIRKTAPKEWTDYLFVNPKAKPEPMDVYIYCTKSGVVIEKDCGLSFPEPINGKVIAKFTLREMEAFYYFDDELCRRACLDREQMADYLGDKLGYAWHISDLVIFDKPKELSDFRSNKVYVVNPCRYTALPRLDRAPQSWCYVED